MLRAIWPQFHVGVVFCFSRQRGRTSGLWPATVPIDCVGLEFFYCSKGKVGENEREDVVEDTMAEEFLSLTEGMHTQ